MKTKKILFTVLTVTLVIALIISCAELLDNQNLDSNNKEEQVAPPGKAFVRLNIVNSNARTVMPDVSGYTNISDFSYFNLIVKDSANNSITNPTALQGDFAYSSTIFSANPFTLDTAKTYKFTLIAFKGIVGSGTAIATGERSITVSGNATETIALKEIMDGDGTGTLSVDPNITDGSTATVTLASLSAGGTTGITAVAVPYNNSAIKTGYYLMTIDLSKSKHEPIKVIEVVYIWQGLTTIFDDTVPALRPNVHTINFNYGTDTNAGPGNDGKDTEEVNHGGYFTTSIGDTNSVTNEILAGWFTSLDGGTTLVNQIYNASDATNKTMILKSYDLYAKWVATTSSFELDPTINWTGETKPTFTGNSTVSQGGNINISVTVSNDTAFKNFKWYVDGTEQTLQTTKTLTITGTVSTLLTWYQKGAHIITLYAEDAVDSKPYTGTWTITVTD